MKKGKYKLEYKIEKIGVQTPKKKVYLNLYEGWTKMKLQVKRKKSKETRAVWGGATPRQ